MIATQNHRHRLAPPLAWIAALLPLAVAACGRVPGQFEILNDQVPTNTCTIPTDPTVYSGEGTLDLSIVRIGFPTAYFFFPLIENNLPAATSSAIDPNQIQLTGFNVDISTIGDVPAEIKTSLSATAASNLHYQVPWSGGVDSGGGKLSAAVEAFPVSLAMDLLAGGGFGLQPTLTVNLTVQALGTTNSGSSMQSDPFNFPVQVCAGCLVANIEPCPFTSPPANTGNPCNAAQDDSVDCCTDSGELICPPVVASP